MRCASASPADGSCSAPVHPLSPLSAARISGATPDDPGESAQMVSDRLRAFLTEVDSRHEGTNILLVSHGDVCQILQATVVSAPGLTTGRWSSMSLASGAEKSDQRIGIAGRRLGADSSVTPLLQRGTELGQHRRDYAIETGQLVRVV